MFIYFDLFDIQYRAVGSSRNWGEGSPWAPKNRWAKPWNGSCKSRIWEENGWNPLKTGGVIAPPAS